MKEYYTDQVATNGFIGSLNDFVKDYRLEFDMWIIKQGFDFDKVDMVLIEVNW